MKLRHLSALALVLAPLLSPAAVVHTGVPSFDVIIPQQIELRTSNQAIGHATGTWGWLVATEGAITEEHLRSAVFTGAVSERHITAVNQEFVRAENWTPILPGEAAGSVFSVGAFGSLLNPGEARKSPSGSNQNLSFFSLGFGFPTSPTYRGSTFDFVGTLTIGGQTVTYESEITISRAQASSSARLRDPVRLSSVPEPSSILLLVGALGAALLRRRR